MPDPPSAHYKCAGDTCVEDPSGGYANSDCDGACGGPSPGPAPAPSGNGTCMSSCRSDGDCEDRIWSKNASETGCFKCSRFSNHTGPVCMTLEYACCGHAEPGSRADTLPTCDYPTTSRNMPQHLAIGDSITDGQYPYFKDYVNDTLDSHLIPINGGPSSNGVECASVWAQDLDRWDIVTYNFGAWNIGAEDCDLKKNASTGDYLDAALQTYVEQLRNVTAQLKRTKAARNGKLVFVLTTPSPRVKECCDDPSEPIAPGAFGTHTCTKRTVVFNEAAKAVLEPLGVKIMDLYAWVDKKCKTPYAYDCPIQTMKPGDPCQVHFDQPDGWAYVATGYAQMLKEIWHE